MDAQKALVDDNGRKEAEVAVRQWMQTSPITPLLKVELWRNSYCRNG